MTQIATVLIVEDEFAIADLLEMVLVDEGYRVVVAGNGRQGLERLAEGSAPDLVISDFMMPIMDGVTMIQAMRKVERLRNVPCLIISSMPEANVRERVDGYAAFVRKPFKIAALVQLIETVIREARSET
ncbi:response regulator [Lichenifustis flavocetrariae]|uniref:Response regulator n=1 Tax=Lichenifustis flavocetrariae TaxID=2949735 RepID=A0AA41Z3U6_9HYPH|nr:response regulator [Lichenifustis flavocetrariae]MCW6512285.1 response regulator [Lichenifustis flavocetrariae]